MTANRPASPATRGATLTATKAAIEASGPMINYLKLPNNA